MQYTVLGLALLAFWVYCVLDVVMAEATLVRNLPKLVWLVLVILVPTVGGIVWLVAGRPTGATARPGSTERRRPRGNERRHRSRPAPRGPDDDPDFLRRLDEELRRDDDGA